MTGYELSINKQREEGIFSSYATPRVYLPCLSRLYDSMRFQQQRLPVDQVALMDLLAKYGLELIGNPQPLSGGNRSQSLFILTPQGKYILKRYKESLGYSTIVQEHSILTYLAQVDFPAPRLIATSTGETVAHHAESHYALFDYIEGGFQYHNYTLFPGQARQFITIAGQILAHLHLTLRDFVPQGYNPDGFRSYSEDRWRSVEWFIDKLTHCVAKTSSLNGGASNRRAAWLLQQAGYIEKLLIQLEATLNKANLPRLLIHADYGPYNLLFRQSGPAIVLDFEIARLDWRVTELIGAWHRFGHDTWGFRFNKMRWLLDAYQTHFPLTDIEWQLIPAVWQILNIWQCLMNWYRYCENRVDTYLAKARWNLEAVNWMTAHQDKFLSKLC